MIITTTGMLEKHFEEYLNKLTKRMAPDDPYLQNVHHRYWMTFISCAIQKSNATIILDRQSDGYQWRCNLYSSRSRVQCKILYGPENGQLMFTRAAALLFYYPKILLLITSYVYYYTIIY